MVIVVCMVFVFVEVVVFFEFVYIVGEFVDNKVIDKSGSVDELVVF